MKLMFFGKNDSNGCFAYVCPFVIIQLFVLLSVQRAALQYAVCPYNP